MNLVSLKHPINPNLLNSSFSWDSLTLRVYFTEYLSSSVWSVNVAFDKEQLSKILYTTLCNAYDYKSNKILDLSFEEFLDAFKYSEKDELESSVDELTKENEKLKALSKKYALEIEKIKIEKKDLKD